MKLIPFINYTPVWWVQDSFSWWFPDSVERWRLANESNFKASLALAREKWGSTNKTCECCKKTDNIEFMHNRPDGYYCTDCYEDIFN